MFREMIDYIKDKDLKIEVFNNKIHIINYYEVSSYEDKEIKVKTKNFLIVITGESLEIKKLFDYELLIEGEIKNIEFRWSIW